jgi:hypothetical protein
LYGAYTTPLTEGQTDVSPLKKLSQGSFKKRIVGGITVNENSTKQCNKWLMQLFGDLDIPSFVRTSLLNWIGPINRTDSKRKQSQVFNNNAHGSRLRGRPKNRWWNCVQKDVNRRKIKNWKELSKNRLTGEKSALKCRRR